MQDLRNGFANAPSPSGQVRRWPLDVDQLDTGEQVLVRYAGENVVYESPTDLLDAMLAASNRFERALARRVAAEVAQVLQAERRERRRRDLNRLFLVLVFAPLALAVLL